MKHAVSLPWDIESHSGCASPALVIPLRNPRAAEVPLPIPGDRRAWDRMMRRAGLVIGIEAETRPTDAQELGRRLALKKRDGGGHRVILVLADTGLVRRFVRLDDLETAFPVAGKVALRALSEGRDPGGDAIVLI